MFITLFTTSVLGPEPDTNVSSPHPSTMYSEDPFEFHFIHIRGGLAISIVTGLRAGRSGVRLPVEARNVFL
jgi:hypothetical protein